jgi:membrane protease YdiL (CAAX protease family)
VQFTLFLAGVFWIMAAGSLAARAAQGIVTRLDLPVFDDVLQQLFFVFLLLWGFATIRWIATRAAAPSADYRTRVLETNSLPRRTTTAQEWQRGAALGWAMLLLAVLPMTLTGALHPEFSLGLHDWGLALLSLATIALATLSLELAFRGFILARLIAVVGPTLGTLLISFVYALLSSSRPNATGLSMIVTFCTAVLYSCAYLRTRGLWLGWGLHFAWNTTMAVLFGLPIAGYATYNNLIFTSVSGPAWITGGAYGPEGAFLTLVALLFGLIFLYRITRDYAWEYTHVPIVSAGYPMDIAPPAAHTAMEAAAAPAPLVQILGATPTASSTNPVIDEHLRREPDAATHD